MRLILDGYNLIGALKRYATRNTGSLDVSRELLVNDTLKAAGWTGDEIVVVFDAARSPTPGRTEVRAGGAVRVIYSTEGQTADDLIERLVAAANIPMTVCTGDFALQRAVLARGGTRSTPREFEELLNELPTVTKTPSTPFHTMVVDRLSPETLQALEELRRRPGGG
jgi:predicted RNA-binding protein with PIN domain